MSKKEAVLATIIRDILWMARRYADNRMTFAPSTVNEAIDKAKALGIEIHGDVDVGMYARDGQLGSWNSEKQRFEKE